MDSERATYADAILDAWDKLSYIQQERIIDLLESRMKEPDSDNEE